MGHSLPSCPQHWALSSRDSGCWAGAVTRPQLPVPTPLLTWPRAPGLCRLPFRPNLISLDLSFNNLTDLQSMVAGLQTLPHLRLLLLQGNPLALVPHYRGLTIDSLARLCVLDDITVSSNEKHLFRGLSHSEGEGGKAQGMGELSRGAPPGPPTLLGTHCLVCHPAPHLTQTPVRCNSLSWAEFSPRF